MKNKPIIKNKKILVILPSEFNLIKLIPNIATIAALCMGLTAIRFGILGKFEYAVLSIIAAAFLDGIDGRLARFLKVTSEFGAEMDSLSDFISFGVSPAIVIYLAIMNQWRNIGWGMVLFFAVCMAFRLARFNVLNIDSRHEVSQEVNLKYKNKFMGVPAPASAMLSLFPLILNFAFKLDIILMPLINGIVLISTGMLAVSRIPTPSFKSFTFERRWTFVVLLSIAIIIVGLIIDHWVTLSFMIFSYLTVVIYNLINNYRKN